MGYRNIVIESSANLFCRNNQLIIQGDAEHSIPIEDLNAILLESKQSNISTALLAKMIDKGVTVYICDDKHLPSGVLFPFAQHSRQLSIIKLQDKLTLPAKKRLWQQIIQAKISNQSLCLRYVGLDDEADYLERMSTTVASGDNAHLEATAAAYYFPKLFGDAFTRQDSLDARNACLNYGYSIIRGNTARLLAVYGFFPSSGIYHRSELNAFNLADDIMEPFRPIVDLYVAQNIGEEEMLTPNLKHQLFNLLNVDVLSGKQRHSVAYATERVVQSLSRCMADYQNNKLLLPELLRFKQHSYE